MAEIKLDDAQINKALEAAILVAIGEAGREAIITKAVDYLKRSPTSGYNSASPLMEIVQEAARQVAKTLLKDKLAADSEFGRQVVSLYADAARKMFSVENRDKMVDRLANVMADALTKERY